MKAAVVSIGNELLNGQTVDTNASWLAGRLFEMGIATVNIRAVPDDIEMIVQTLNQVSTNASLILMTGGLGPTDDDITRQAVANYMGVQLQFHQHLLDWLVEFFESRGRKMAEKNRSQAYIPVGCQILDNPRGTAPGFWGQKADVFVAAMPGVPSEMKYMFQNQISDRIQGIHHGSVVVSGKVRCFGPGESTLAQKLGDLMDRNRNPLINCTCGAGDLLLHVVASASDRQTASQMVADDKAMLASLLDSWIYGYDDDTLPVIIGRLLKQKGKTIALAESCTAGMVSSMLADVPGASEYLLAGWVTYSNDAKIQLLSVPAALILEHGAVSEPVALAMAKGAAEKSGADVSIGITGIAGPGGGTDEKPVGLVYISLYVDGKCKVKECRFPAVNRDFIRRRSALTALNLIRNELCI